MSSPIPPHDAQRALTALGVTTHDVETIRRVPIEQARELLRELKAKARRNYKRLALELHPDRTQGDATKAEFFVLLGRVLEELDKTQVQPPPPQPFINVSFAPMSWQRAMHVHGHPWTTVTTTGSATTTTFTTQQVIRVVKMKPR